VSPGFILNPNSEFMQPFLILVRLLFLQKERNMFKTQKLGELEELVLLAIGGLSDEAYTVSIQQLLESTTGRVVSMGALYTSLERLRKKGYADSTMTQPTAERGGKSKRVYAVTFEGERALKETRAARELLWNKFNWSQAWS